MKAEGLLRRLVPLDELKATALRFPLSVSCAFVLFVIGMMIIHDVIDDNNRDIARLCTWLGCLYLWFGVVKLAVESLQLSRVWHAVLAIAGAGALAGFIFIPNLWGMHLTFILPALLLMIMCAPYLRGGDDLSFWFFNRSLWMGVLVSNVALLMFAGGLSLALLAVQELFNIDFSDKIWAQLWLFACSVLAPVYALSWVPKGFVFGREDCNDLPGLKFLANWISAPMVFVYLLILYAYFVRIIILGEVPNGILAYLITGFIGAGVMTYLISWPLREEGTLQLKFLHRIFFPAMLIPTGFHFFAIYERVSAYGFTEQRYYLFLSALWFAFLAIGFTLRKLPMKWIPLSLAGLLFFGALSGVSVSSHSQMSRLSYYLEKNNLIENGQIKKAEKESDIPFEDRREISSILDYLCSSDRDDLIAHLFEFKDYSGKPAQECYGAYEITRQLGFEHIDYYVRESKKMMINIPHHAPNQNYLDVRGYDYVLKSQYAYIGSCEEKFCLPPARTDIPVRVMLVRGGDIMFYHGSDLVLEHDLRAFVMEKLENKSEPAVLVLENDRIKIKMDFGQIYGEMKDGTPYLNTLSFDLYYRFKE